jgi:hypothetical protein
VHWGNDKTDGDRSNNIEKVNASVRHFDLHHCERVLNAPVRHFDLHRSTRVLKRSRSALQNICTKTIYNKGAKMGSHMRTLQIVINSPTAGEYTIEVVAHAIESDPSDGPQLYSFVVSHNATFVILLLVEYK